MTTLVEEPEQRFHFASRPNATLAARAAGVPVLDVVVPVYNEQATLAHSVRRLHRYLAENFAVPVRITIADNASVDETPCIAAELAADLAGLHGKQLDGLTGRHRTAVVRLQLQDSVAGNGHVAIYHHLVVVTAGHPGTGRMRCHLHFGCRTGLQGQIADRYRPGRVARASRDACPAGAMRPRAGRRAIAG